MTSLNDDNSGLAMRRRVSPRRLGWPLAAVALALGTMTAVAAPTAADEIEASIVTATLTAPQWVEPAHTGPCGHVVAGGIATVTVTVADQTDAPMANVPVTFTVDDPDVSGIPDQPVLTDQSGVASVLLNVNAVAERLQQELWWQWPWPSFQVAATVEAGDGSVVTPNGSPATIELVPPPEYSLPAPSHLEMTATNGGSSVLADGVDSWTGRLFIGGCLMIDLVQNGVEVTAADVSFQVPATVTVTPVVKGADGYFTAAFTSTTPAEDLEITALYQGEPIPEAYSQAISFEAAPVAPKTGWLIGVFMKLISWISTFFGLNWLISPR